MRSRPVWVASTSGTRRPTLRLPGTSQTGIGCRQREKNGRIAARFAYAETPLGPGRSSHAGCCNRYRELPKQADAASPPLAPFGPYPRETSMKIKHALIALALTAACGQSLASPPVAFWQGSLHPSAKTGSSACGKPH